MTPRDRRHERAVAELAEIDASPVGLRRAQLVDEIRRTAFVQCDQPGCASILRTPRPLHTHLVGGWIEAPTGCGCGGLDDRRVLCPRHTNEADRFASAVRNRKCEFCQ